MNFERLKQISLDLKAVPTGKSKHFSFLLSKNRIISIGWNQKKTHPKTQQWYPYPYIHSEFMAVYGKGKGNILVNTRVADYGFGLARPCGACVEMLRSHRIMAVYYTGHNGEFEFMNLGAK